MITPIAQRSQASSVSYAPTSVMIQRGLLAACVVLAPLIIGLSFVFDPTHGVPRGAASIYTAFHAAGATQIQVFLWLNTVAVFLFAPSYVGLGIVAMRRSPWLATFGVIAGFIGSLPWAVFVFAETLSAVMAQQGSSAAFASAFGGASAVNVVALLQYSWVIGHLLGYLLLGLALARMTPRWAGWLLIAGVPLQMIAYPTQQGIFQMLGFFLVCIGSLPAAWELLRSAAPENAPGV